MEKIENCSYEEYLKIRNAQERMELIFGRIYTIPAATALHQDTVGNIFCLLKKMGGCRVRFGPYDLKLFCPSAQGGYISVVQPDVMLFCDGKSVPCAIFEVLSAATAYKDKEIKKRLYECVGVREYFIVEPEYCLVEKFVLEDGKYRCVGSFYEEAIEIGCARSKVMAREFFEGIVCAAEQG